MQITKRIIILMLIISALLLIAAACDNPSSIVDHSTEEVANIPKSNALDDHPMPTIDVCEPLDVPGVAFPRQEYVEGPRVMMVAVLVGDLVLIDGCLQIFV